MNVKEHMVRVPDEVYNRLRGIIKRDGVTFSSWIKNKVDLDMLTIKADTLDILMERLMSFEVVNADNWPDYRATFFAVIPATAVLKAGKLTADIDTWKTVIDVINGRMHTTFPKEYRDELITVCEREISFLAVRENES